MEAGAHGNPPPLASRVVVVVGAPCAGKGTQCKRIAAATGAVHLSTGDMFRAAVKAGTELGAMAQAHIERREFVPDDIVTAHVLEQLRRPDVVANGALLDGFPRTADQARALLCACGPRLVTLQLEVPAKALVRRAAGRLIAPSGEIYHAQFCPPPPGAPAMERQFDRDAKAFRTRLAVFDDQLRRTVPLLGSVQKVSGAQEPDAVFAALMRAISAVPAAPAPPAASAAQAACVICCDRPADFLVTPCGHQCGCQECLDLVVQRTGTCPICRTRISSLQKVFRVGGPDDAGAVRAEAGPVAALHTGPGAIDTENASDDDEWPEPPALVSEDEAAEPEADEEAGQTGFTLKVVPATDVSASGAQKVNVCIQIGVPEVKTEAERQTGVDIACVIDTSGSMGGLATREDEHGNAISDGLSILDIVKHAVKTVIHTLGDHDRLTLVGFSNTASQVLPLTSMDTDGRATAAAALEQLRPSGSTNLWGGVLAGLDALRTGDEGGGRHKSVLVLTDGVPNVQPPHGEVAELKEYFELHAAFASALQMNTFGFGYQLNSKLLLQLAESGNGTFAFIPDAVITGTVFVNSIANVCSCHTPQAFLSLAVGDDAAFAGPVLGDLRVAQTGRWQVVELGPLQWGQTRDVVVPLDIPAGDAPFLHASLTSTNPATGAQVRHATALGTQRTSSADAVLASLRAQTVSIGKRCLDQAESGDGKTAEAGMAQLCSMFEATPPRCTSSAGGLSPRTSLLAPLRADVQGRMSKALKGKKRFDRWGRHYLRAIIRAHQLQLCTNFMDAGLQPYSGKLFSALRAKGDAVFVSLPPPKPQAQAAPKPGAARPGAAPAPNMTTYYAGAGGGCFHADALVERAAACCSLTSPQSRPTRIAEIRAGDVVKVAAGWSKVRCLVRLARCASKPLAVLPGGLLSTPRHPVRIGGEWMPAASADGARLLAVADCSYVYTLLLEDNHVLLVNGVECITWGHCSADPCLAHPFFGSDKVVRALEGMHGFSHGFVCLQGCIRARRNSWSDVSLQTGQDDAVVGFVEVSRQWYVERGLIPAASCTCPPALNINEAFLVTQIAST